MVQATEYFKCRCRTFLATIPVGSPSRLPAFCLSEAVLGSQHRCRWPTASEDEESSVVEKVVKLSAQNDVVMGAEKEKRENKRYSDFE